MARRERDLFESMEETAGGERNAPVELVLVYVDETPKAWLLRRAGRPGSQAHVPKSLATRGEPPHDDVFAMPRWAAADRGWL